jgi:hypothetical protein
VASVRCPITSKLYLEAAGEIRYRAKVDKILVEDGKVTGVRSRTAPPSPHPSSSPTWHPTPPCWILLAPTPRPRW